MEGELDGGGIHVLTLMTVNGHPDDETVSTGGVLARYAAEGLRVVCVSATRGEVGEIVDEELNTPENLSQLGAIREAELRRSMDRLRVRECFFLDYRDSGMAGTPENDDPRSFWQADLDEAAGRLARLVRAVQPDVILCPNAFGGDGHPDHVRAAAIAQRAFQQAGSPDAWPDQLEPGGVRPWTPSKLYETVVQLDRREKLRRVVKCAGIRGALPIVVRAGLRWRPWQEGERSRAAAAQGPVTTRVDVRAVMDAKHAALAEYRSQFRPDGDRLALSAEERRRVTPTENFTLVTSRIKTAIPEDDLFDGLR